MESTTPLVVAIVNCDNPGSAWLPSIVGLLLVIFLGGSPFAFSLGGEVAGPGEMGDCLAVKAISSARPAKRIESRSGTRTQWTTSKTKHIRP